MTHSTEDAFDIPAITGPDQTVGPAPRTRRGATRPLRRAATASQPYNSPSFREANISQRIKDYGADLARARASAPETGRSGLILLLTRRLHSARQELAAIRLAHADRAPAPRRS